MIKDFETKKTKTGSKIGSHIKKNKSFYKIGGALIIIIGLLYIIRRVFFQSQTNNLKQEELKVKENAKETTGGNKEKEEKIEVLKDKKQEIINQLKNNIIEMLKQFQNLKPQATSETDLKKITSISEFIGFTYNIKGLSNNVKEILDAFKSEKSTETKSVLFENNSTLISVFEDRISIKCDDGRIAISIIIYTSDNYYEISAGSLLYCCWINPHLLKIELQVKESSQQNKLNEVIGYDNNSSDPSLFFQRNDETKYKPHGEIKSRMVLVETSDQENAPITKMDKELIEPFFKQLNSILETNLDYIIQNLNDKPITPITQEYDSQNNK